MTKPIESTPILYGKDAERFIKMMIKEETHPSKKRINMIKEAMKITKEHTNHALKCMV